MHPTLIAAIAGPTFGTVLSIILYLAKKNMDNMTHILNNVNNTVVELAIEIPKIYCTKEELSIHIRSEQMEHHHTNVRLEQIRNEISLLHNHPSS